MLKTFWPSLVAILVAFLVAGFAAYFLITQLPIVAGLVVGKTALFGYYWIMREVEERGVEVPAYLRMPQIEFIDKRIFQLQENLNSFRE